jgi:archaellin
MALWQFFTKIINNKNNKELYGNAILQLNIALTNGKVTNMDNFGTTGITTMALLGSIVIAGGASSFMLQNTDTLSTNAQHMINDVIDEIVTYLKIDDVIGKYYTDNGNRRVERIVILVKQPIKNTINMSDLTIKLCNNEDVILLGYSGHAEEYNSKGVFENQVWETTNNAFSLIVVIDTDKSLIDYNIMNGDIAFIAIKLPDRFTIDGNEAVTVSIIPAKGIVSSVVLEAPSFHSSDIISFGDV